MKQLFPVLVFISFVATAEAQQADFSFFSPAIPSKKINALFISSEFSFASNAMTNELAKTYFLKGFITEEMKNGVSEHLDAKNRLGGEFNTEIYFSHRPDSLFGRKDLSWYIGFKNINQLHATFTRDLFEIYFRGNKNYAGKTATLGEFSYQLLKYQQLQFGMMKTITSHSARMVMGTAIGLNAGQQLLSIEVPQATLFTEATGEYLDASASVEIHKSDSLKESFGSLNGFGLSTDIFFNADAGKKNFFFARVSNLGFIQWNNRTSGLTKDSLFRFEGIDLTQFLNFADTIRSTINPDSALVQPLLSGRKYKSFRLFLPAKFEASYQRAFGKLRAGIGAVYMLHSDDLPLVYLDADYRWSTNELSINVSYGGFTTFGAGMYYRRTFHHGYVFSIGSNYLNSLFNLDEGTSENIHLTLSRNF